MSSTRPVSSLNVSTVMTSDALVTSAERPVLALARDLLAAGLSSIPVVDDAGSLIGMVSELDLLTKPGATVGDVMSRGVVSIAGDASVDDAIRLMSLHGIRRLPVLEGGRLVGVVSRSDLLRLHVDGAPAADGS